MSGQINIFLLILILLALTPACKKGPKVVNATTQGGSNPTSVSQSSGIFDDAPASPSPRQNAAQPASNGMHAVVVNEVLPTSRYVYLNVNEGAEQYWIATRLRDVKKGEKYYFRGGLLKTNFESKEYNRFFDKVYLVSNLVSASHGVNQTIAGRANASPGATVVDNMINSSAASANATTEDKEIMSREGAVNIADLLNDPKKFAGKAVLVSGKCTKVNPNIMNRNWIHIQDGSKDDFDLVVTSNQFVHEGQVVSMRATVVLDRDYGAGYKYDLILENGEIVP